MSFTIRTAEVSDAPVLADLARETFIETFGPLYPPSDLNAFLEQSYALDVIARQIADPNQRWLIAENDGESGVQALGYAQAGPCSLPHPDVRAAHGELKRIYLRSQAKGTGLGRDLMRQILDWIEQSFDGPVWIGVWSENHRAQALYRKFGFEKAGEYEFHVGETRDQEFILMRGR
jgi:ribosomal protein S18 acetylase RimI-like enzyme